jgi:tetratricopeptide (TPR) repeat protein
LPTGLDAHQAAFARNPDDARAFDALQEHFFLEGDWPALVDLYRRRLDAPSMGAQASGRAALLFRLAQIYEERLLDPEAATETYWQLARLDPSHRPALRQLRGIHERAGKWDLVLQIAELEGQTAMPPFERAAFEADLGRIWQQQLDDPDEARKAYERALEAEPDQPEALARLAELHRADGRPEAAVALLERLTTRLRGPERAPAWITLGTLYGSVLGNPTRAAACFDHALEDDPFQPAAVEWALLLATAAEAWNRVAELLERRFDLAVGARQRASIAVEASQLALSELGSNGAARAWVERAWELAPDEPAVLLARADVERREGDVQALLATLDRLIAVGARVTPRALFIEAARLHARFDQPEAALAALAHLGERGRGGDGTDSPELLALTTDLLRRTGDRRALAEVLESWTALDAGDADAERAARLRELAHLYQEHLDDAESAASAWQRAFELDPGHAETRNALEAIHRKSNDTAALRALFETAIAALGTSAPAPLLASLGDLLLDAFDDLSGARQCFDQALERQPGCRPALAGLQRVAQQSDDPDLMLELCEREASGDPAESRMAELVQTVLPILEQRQQLDEAFGWALRWSRTAPGRSRPLELCADLAQRLDRPDAELDARRTLARLQAGAARSSTLLRVSRLETDRRDPQAAVGALEEASLASPDDLEILEALCEGYRRAGSPRELAQALRRRADLLPPEQQAAPLEELAQLLQDPLGDLPAAIVVRWRLIALPQPPQGSQQALEALLEGAGRYAELVQLLDERRERIGDDSTEAFALDRRRARLRLDALGRSEESVAILARLQARHPEDESLLDDLERALRVSGDARALCRILEQRTERERNGSRRLDLLLERASLLQESLAEPLIACDLLEAIAFDPSLPPRAREALEQLEALLASSGQWRRLRDLLLRRLGDSPTHEQLALRERIAQLCIDRLQDAEGGAEQYEAILRIDPERVLAWQALEALYAHDPSRSADWLRVVEGELAHAPATERELLLRIAAARLLLDDQRRPRDWDAATAYRHYERVLELDPSHSEATEVLASHYQGRGQPAEAARVLERRLTREALDGAPESDGLRLRLAGLYLDELDDLERARELFQALRGVAGLADAVAEPLAEIYHRAADESALAGLCREVLARSEPGPASLPWRMRLGASEARQGHLEEAALAYRTAWIDAPNDREIEDALIAIYREIGEAEPLVELLEKRLPFAAADEALGLRLELAALHADSREEPREALAQLEAILELHPHHREACDRALALAESLGDSDQCLALLERALGSPLPGAERARLLELRGRLLAEGDTQPERALPCFREALALDPSRRDAREALLALLERLGRWPALLDRLFLEASEAGDDRRIELFEQALAIAWERLGPDAALPWLVRLRAEQPDDPDLLARMAEAHRRAGRFEAALRAMDEELALRSEPGEHGRLHRARAEILEHELGAPSRATLAYHQALEVDEDADDVLAELDRLYEYLQRPFERAAILERRVRGLDGRAGYALREALASLYCIDLAMPERAVEPLLRNVEATRDDPERELRALAALDAALQATARFDAWARAAERRLELIEGHPEIARATPEDSVRALREELARVYDEEVGNPDRALALLRRLGEEESEAGYRARVRLRDLLRRTGRRLELAESLDRDLAAGRGEPDEWLELGRLQEEVLGDCQSARLAYEQLHRMLPDSLEAIRGLRRCCERLRDWPGLADALTLEIDRTEDGAQARSRRAALAQRLGDLCWQRLAAGERAAAAYGRALDLEPGSSAILRALASVHEACGDEARALPLHRRELALLPETAEHDDRRRALWLRIATLERDHGTPASAIEAYRAAAAIERLSAHDELCLARLSEVQGDFEGFVAAFGGWCDREDSAAAASDHLELAGRLLEIGDADRARLRAERATLASAPAETAAWLFLAELERGAGRLEAAAGAFEAAADRADPETSARHRASAAALLDDTDPTRAHALLERAVVEAPGSIEAAIALVRLAARLGHDEQVVCEAERTLTLSEVAAAEPEVLAAEVRGEIALLGGRSARRLGQRSLVRRLFRIVLDLDPDQPEALEGLAEADFEDGEHRAARPLLERRLALSGENPAGAVQRAMIGRCLEAEGLPEAAQAHYEEALALSADLELAYEGLVRVHERAARTDEALGVLEAWADHETDPVRRAAICLRAGEAAWAAGGADRAERHLRTATGADPRLTPAWLLLTEIVGSRRIEDETRRVCEKALHAVVPDALSALISLRLARLEEAAGRREAARERYAEAARWEPRCVEAVLCESRLARMAGDWVAADGVLARFVDAHPDATSPTLAVVLVERGRLLSGPLEDFSAAIRAYEQALRLQPELGVARTALAGLLLHAPGRAADALALHRSILDEAPTCTSSLRALIDLAAGHGQPEIAESARAVLCALGQASPAEESRAPDRLRLDGHPGPPLPGATDEGLRRLAYLLREELGPFLQEVDRPPIATGVPAIDRTIAEILELESELTAPGLSLLTGDERRDLFRSLASLLLDSRIEGGDRERRIALDRALGRWTRRKARRILEETSLSDIEAIDQTAWASELRALAAAQLVDRNGGDLASVLRALLVLEGGDPTRIDAEEATIAARVERSRPGRTLLTRILRQLGERLAKAIAPG